VRALQILEREREGAELQRALRAYVVARYDGERGEGWKAGAQYGLDGFPTLILVDADGRELARQTGAGDGRQPDE